MADGDEMQKDGRGTSVFARARAAILDPAFRRGLRKGYIQAFTWPWALLKYIRRSHRAKMFLFTLVAIIVFGYSQHESSMGWSILAGGVAGWSLGLALGHAARHERQKAEDQYVALEVAKAALRGLHNAPESHVVELDDGHEVVFEAEAAMRFVAGRSLQVIDQLENGERPLEVKL